MAALALHLSKQLAWELGLGVAARGRPTSIDASAKPSSTEAVGVEHNVVRGIKLATQAPQADVCAVRRTYCHSVGGNFNPAPTPQPCRFSCTHWSPCALVLQELDASHIEFLETQTKVSGWLNCRSSPMTAGASGRTLSQVPNNVVFFTFRGALPNSALAPFHVRACPTHGDLSCGP